jgi:hypothetical protein
VPRRIEDLVNPEDELFLFLDNFSFVYPNLNDTFAYATADTERMYMDGEDNQAMLVYMWREYGTDGIHAYAAKIRGKDVLPELRTEKYHAALRELKDWEYEGD